MGLPVMVMGRSGSGKTYALKNFKPDEVGVISVEKGRLPFRSDLKTVRVPKSFDSDDIKSYAQLNAAKYAWIEMMIQRSKAKSIVIDDSQYLLVNELFDRSAEKGYDKFTNVAKDFYDLVQTAIRETSDDTIVYFLMHTERSDDGDQRSRCHRH